MSKSRTPSASSQDSLIIRDVPMEDMECIDRTMDKEEAFFRDLIYSFSYLEVNLTSSG